jgi:hypothetical protein
MATATQPGRARYAIARRWSETLASPDALSTWGGYVPVLRSFLNYYSKLEPPVTSAEAMLVIHLMAFKWTVDAPFPGYRTLAKLMGCSPKMVQRHAKALERAGYLKREMRTGQTNKFHLDGLFRALERRLEQVATTSD